MDIEEKDKYIEDHLMKLQPDTLRFMVADLSFEVDRLQGVIQDIVDHTVCDTCYAWQKAVDALATRTP